MGRFTPSRLIDLSYAAAYKLGYAGNGSAEVVVERVRAGDVEPPTARCVWPTSTRVMTACG